MKVRAFVFAALIALLTSIVSAGGAVAQQPIAFEVSASLQPRAATLGEGQDDPYTWTFWHLDWEASPGEHTITSRATSSDGEVQPAADDPRLVNKRTYWESNGQLSRGILIE